MRLGRALAFACLVSLAADRDASADLVIYDDALAAGWEDWSYNATAQFANAFPVHAGVASILVTTSAQYGGLSLRIAPPLAGSSYSALRLWIRGAVGTANVAVYTQSSDGGGNSPSYPVSAPEGPWTQVVIPLSALGSPAQIARINIQDESGALSASFYVDDVSLASAPAGGFPDAVADRVLGQTGFQSGAAGTHGAALNGPAGVAVAPSGRVFVVDFFNNRVLSWPDASDFANGASADLVLGQPDLTSFGSGDAANRMNLPESVAVDAAGNVFVADSFNHRVMVFEPPLATGISATTLFGANDCDGDPAPNGFCFPRGVATDAAGNLYLVDEFNHRVQIYTTPVASGDYVPDETIEGLNEPRGVAVDAAQRVYVTDSENDRVLRFDQPLATDTVSDRTYGEAPDGVDCETQTNGLGITASRFACPIDLAIDAAGNLFVSDLYDHRILAFEDPVGGDAVADAVYGQQGSFTTGGINAGGLGAGSMWTPLGLAFGLDGDLLLADFGNNRVLAYDAPVPEPGALAAGSAGLAALLGLARRRRHR
jgi:sugar lactone lactonase YvrE